MADPILLKLNGEVERPLKLTFSELLALHRSYQIDDVSRIDPKRQGTAVKLVGLLEVAAVRTSARYLGLHSSLDDFHASIPLEPVRDRALVIYQVDGKPLATSQGGPLRFYIPDFAACHTDEIDECANVKFIDHVELTAEKGFDNRPKDDDQHEALHRKS